MSSVATDENDGTADAVAAFLKPPNHELVSGTRGLAFLYNAPGSVSIAIIEAVVMEAHDFVPTYWICNKVTKGIILRCPSRCRHILHFLQGSLL